MFSINPDLDVADIATRFRQERRVVIPDFLQGDAAERLYEHLRDHRAWLEVFNDGDKLYELSRDQQNAMSEVQREQLKHSLYQNLRAGFQYRYETIRVPDDNEDRANSKDILSKFAQWMSSEKMLRFLNDIFGAEGVNFLDAQATAYSPGHFLSGHDDDFTGKNRSAAYVLGLTPIWRPEWGGLLLFHGPDQRWVDGIVPGFNQLNLFAVPQMHSVSEVSQAAAFRRYSVTGWARAL